MLNHRLQSNRPFPERRLAFSIPLGTNSRPRTILACSWLFALIWFPPTSANGQGICDRTPQVRDKLIELTGASACGEVTSAQLAGIRELDLAESGIAELRQPDFSGLNSLKWLRLNNNSLTELPQGIFRGLNTLEVLWLHTTVPTFYCDNLVTH